MSAIYILKTLSSRPTLLTSRKNSSFGPVLKKLSCFEWRCSDLLHIFNKFYLEQKLRLVERVWKSVSFKYHIGFSLPHFHLSQVFLPMRPVIFLGVPVPLFTFFLLESLWVSLCLFLLLESFPQCTYATFSIATIPSLACLHYNYSHFLYCYSIFCQCSCTKFLGITILFLYLRAIFLSRKSLSQNYLFLITKIPTFSDVRNKVLRQILYSIIR